MSSPKNSVYDVVIVGGGYAGMAAALQLARARRKVAVVDTGSRRNRFAEFSHGVLALDGKSPSAIAATAKAQLLEYPDITWISAAAARVRQDSHQFAVHLVNGTVLHSQRIILATGVSDALPEVPGLSERWGRSVFHCPYCHGFELNQGVIGVLAVGEVSLHQALLLPDWGPTIFFMNGLFEPTSEQAARLVARNVRIERTPVLGIGGRLASVQLTDGRSIDCAGLFVASRTAPLGPFAGQLGCEIIESPWGTYIRTDEFRATTVKGVFACGDAARPGGNVTLAMADGVMAGSSAHRTLVFGFDN
jgi:thioredoxin reductase